jgi:hypothetical protein
VLGSQAEYAHLCQGMLTHEYTYAFGAVDVCTGELDSLILPHVNTGVHAAISQRGRCYATLTKSIVMVIDGAGWHRSESNSRPPDNIHLLTSAALRAGAQPD